MNSLDQMLKEALRQAHAVRHPTHHRPSLHERYADPQSWRAARAIELIYDDGQGNLSSLGIFREYLCQLPPGGRRLEPGCLEGPDREFEFVRGEYWVNPRQPALIPEEDFDELKSRLLELLEEFED